MNVHLATEVPEVVLRELSSRDVDVYYALSDRNRAHLNRHGDYQFERDATLDDVRVTGISS